MSLWPVTTDKPKDGGGLQLVAASTELDGIGYKFMAGGRLMTQDRQRGEADQQTLEAAQDAFEAKIGDVEQLLGKHPEGPFFMGCSLLPSCILAWLTTINRGESCRGLQG